MIVLGVLSLLVGVGSAIYQGVASAEAKADARRQANDQKKQQKALYKKQANQAILKTLRETNINASCGRVREIMNDQKLDKLQKRNSMKAKNPNASMNYRVAETVQKHVTEGRQYNKGSTVK